MNKKGMTLIELIVSIAMLSVALVFMYGLMTNLQRKKNDNDAYTDDIMKIVDIETNIQKSLMDGIEFGRTTVPLAVVRDSGESDWSHDLIGLIFYSKNEINKENVIYGKEIGWSKDSESPQSILTKYYDKSSDEWIIEKKWSLNKSVKTIDAKICCSSGTTFYNTELKETMCQINFYLKDDSAKVIDVVNVPLYFKSNNFNSWFTKTRIDDSC